MEYYYSFEEYYDVTNGKIKTEAPKKIKKKTEKKPEKKGEKN